MEGVGDRVRVMGGHVHSTAVRVVLQTISGVR